MQGPAPYLGLLALVALVGAVPAALVIFSIIF